MEVLLRERPIAAIYDALAPDYDAFTSHHDYATWTTGLLGLARRHGLRGDRCLDVGCGTGKSLAPLVEAGWRGVGCDVSAQMLAQAVARLGGRAPLHLLDARRLPRLGLFDLVWALDDVANYMLDATELVALLRGMAANLDSGGVLLFDTNTLWTYRTFFAQRHTYGGLVWEGRATAAFAPGELAQADLAGARHRQRHHPPAVIARCLRAAGLEPVAVYGQFPDGTFRHPLDELRHNKAIHIACLGHAH